jgi:ribonuclease H2 subunit A
MASSFKASSHGLFDALLRKDSDYFVLKLENTPDTTTTNSNANNTIWLNDDQKKLYDYFEHYVNLTIGKEQVDDSTSTTSNRPISNRGQIVHLEIVPMNQMPFSCSSSSSSCCLKISIPSTKTKFSDLSQKPFLVYVIEVSFNEMKWEVTRRFKEFEIFHAQLKKRFFQSLNLNFINHHHPKPQKNQNNQNNQNNHPKNHQEKKKQNFYFPRLPRKFFLFKLSKEMILQRRLALEAYLKEILSLSYLSNDVLFLSFLGIVSTSREKEIVQHELNVVHISCLHFALNYGDIILFSCRFGASLLQRKITGAKYDHVGIVVPSSSNSCSSRNFLQIMEATGEGIQVYSLKARLMAYAREVSKKIVVRTLQVERTKEIEQQFKEFVSRVEGNKYSIMGILQTRSDSASKNIDKISETETETETAATKTKKKTTATSVVPFGDLNTLMNATSITTTSSSNTSTTTSSSSSISEKEEENHDKKDKRKYFCSSLVAATLKHVGWLQTKHSSSYFWPGSFEEGGEIEKFLRQDIQISSEQVIDCRIVEVGLATTTIPPQQSSKKTL